MTKDEALRLALEALKEITLEHGMTEKARTAIKAALLSRSGGEAKDEPDWKDMYEKQKRHTEMWVAKYEKDTGPLEKAVPHQEAKYEPVAHSVVAGALFDFMGWLTSREKRLILSSVDEASPAVEAITEFAKKRNLSLKYAEVGYWMEFLSTPPQQEAKDEPVPVAIVEVFGKDWRLDYMALPVGKHKLYAQQYTYTTPQQEAKDEPVAWDGYNLDDMCEAFNRVIEEHFHRKHPFHDPVNNDAMIALRTLRGFIPYMKRHTTPPQRKPLTDEEIDQICCDVGYGYIAVARANEAAHGITGENT